MHFPVCSNVISTDCLNLTSCYLLCVLPDLVDSCSSLSNDELVELLEDVNLDLVVGLQKVLVPLLDLNSALVHILLGSTQLDNLRFGANVRERDLDASIAETGRWTIY